MIRPIEAKVKAATAGAGAGSAVGALVVWLLDSYVHTPDVSGDLPEPIAAAVLVVVAGIAAYVSGWLAKHTARPDLDDAA